MNGKLLILLTTILFFVSGCGKDEVDPVNTAILEVSDSSFDSISEKGSKQIVHITCDTTWTATSNTTWCTPNPATGTNNQTISITIDENKTYTARTATVTITSEKAQKKG